MNHLFKKTMVLTLSIFFLCFFSLSAQNPDVIRQAAEKGAAQFMKNQSHPGISINASITDVAVHTGFRVYSVAPDLLMDSKHLFDAIFPTDLWRFLILNQGKPFSLLTVGKIDEKWQAVSMGGAQLSVEIAAVMEQWPTKSGYDLRFVRVYQARADFMEISQNKRVLGYVPLVSSRVALGLSNDLKPSMLLTSPEIIEPLRNIVSENLKATARATEK